MVDASRSPSRVPARLAAVAGTVLPLGAGGHVAGTGTLPDGRALAVLAALTAAGAAPLARRPLRVSTLLPAVAVWQWLLHRAFAATAAVDAVAGGERHVHGATASMPVSGTGVGAHATSVAMAAAHVAATALTVTLLVATERAAQRSLDRLAWALPVLVGAAVLPVVGTARRRPVRRRRHRATPRTRTLGAHGSRAPPAAARV
ncbi:hypothetical protein [Cellulomonas dongxiuzhuiae]|uniref:hypothetical protein n=1 Tax=Cellulomonas dongxiuzhuiae TaxID=2819979 RepID=UPI001AAFD15C|nr:hypothetical protein [Cellulomonas dongxiuzhuiae]MBO3089737.1 hypothetical protein [Cellulomonas dongxiuzhuiae]